MSSEQIIVHGGCTSCGYVMIHMEVAKGCVQCPNCGEWMKVNIKNRGYSAHPASEEDIKEAIRIRNKFIVDYRDVVAHNLCR